MSDEVVVITGANNGLGLGLFRALTGSGKRVVGLDLSVENLPADGAFVCDVTDSERVRATVECIIDRWGRIDILVNNACLAVFAPFEDKTLSDTRREFEVNYFGYVNMISAVLPHMRARGAGVIHNVSSTVGTSGFAGIYGYSSTKGAIDALTRTWRSSFGPTASPSTSSSLRSCSRLRLGRSACRPRSWPMLMSSGRSWPAESAPARQSSRLGSRRPLARSRRV